MNDVIKKVTVKELIEQLSKYPDNLVVTMVSQLGGDLFGESFKHTVLNVEGETEEVVLLSPDYMVDFVRSNIEFENKIKETGVDPLAEMVSLNQAMGLYDDGDVIDVTEEKETDPEE